MGRPKVPLISKREVMTIALRIIDREGLEALTVSRLGSELKVNRASLYHHFRDRNEIVVAAAKLALDEVQIPSQIPEDWRKWMLGNANAYRKALLAHPNLIPVLLAEERSSIALRWVTATVDTLNDLGVPPVAALALFETIEMLVVGSVLYETSARGRHPFPELQEHSLTFDRKFEIASTRIIEAIAEEFDLEPVA